MFRGILTLLVLATTAFQLFGQCKAEAGENRIICIEGPDSTIVGGNPTATLGTPPYQYRWYTKTNRHGYYWPASEMMDDTTVSNPVVTQFYPRLFLEVTDNTGNRCYDSIWISSSYFIHDMIVYRNDIWKGDSVKLSNTASGGYPPYTYHWAPSKWVSDSTALSPWAKPPISTKFKLTITDSAGCKTWSFHTVNVSPFTSSISDVSEHIDVQIFPNPATKQITVWGHESFGSNVTLKITDFSGKRVLTQERTAFGIPINVGHLARGSYEVSLWSAGNRILTDKLILMAP